MVFPFLRNAFSLWKNKRGVLESGLRNLRVARWFSAGDWKVIFKRVSISAKSREQFFGAKIAVGSRQVQREQGTESRGQGLGAA